MSEQNTVLRSMHDVGLAGWFGGSLMGAVGLNGAAAQAANPAERLQIASAGWDRWGPVNLAAIGRYVFHNRERLGVLRVRDGVITLERMYFADEVRPAEGIAPKKRNGPCVHRGAVGGECPGRRAAEAGSGAARCGRPRPRVPGPVRLTRRRAAV